MSGLRIGVLRDYGNISSGSFLVSLQRWRGVPSHFNESTPFDAETQIEGGSDRHAIMIDRDTCTLYELFAAYPRRGGRSIRRNLRAP